MNIGESLIRNAQHFPDKRAIIDASRSVTYAELHDRTNRLANYLLKQGLAQGDLIALSIGSRSEHFEALFAIALESDHEAEVRPVDRRRDHPEARAISETDHTRSVRSRYSIGRCVGVRGMTFGIAKPRAGCIACTIAEPRRRIKPISASCAVRAHLHTPTNPRASLSARPPRCLGGSRLRSQIAAALFDRRAQST